MDSQYISIIVLSSLFIYIKTHSKLATSMIILYIYDHFSIQTWYQLFLPDKQDMYQKLALIVGMVDYTC